MSLAFVFPGQGSQSLGMLSTLARDNPAVRDTFAEASEVLDYDLWDVTQNGPEQKLNSTECTQPAMLTAGVAVWRLWRAKGGPVPDLMAGHSLGEFTALVCADSLDFSQAVELVRYRGQLMQEAAPEGEGAMAAILGLDDAMITVVCHDAGQGRVVEAVNFNAPGQVVIAGHLDAVDRAIAIARERGARQAIKLPISVPAHSDLMIPASKKLAERLGEIAVRVPLIGHVYNLELAAHKRPAEIRSALERQLFHPVLWVSTVRDMQARGVTTVVECGPGKVLTSLNRRIERRGLDLHMTNDPINIETAIESCWEKFDAEE